MLETVQRRTLIWSRNSYDTQLLCLCRSLSHGHDWVFPFSAGLHTFSTTMCTSWICWQKTILRHKMTTHDSKRNRRSQPPPPPAINPPLPATYQNTGVFPFCNKKGENDRLAYVLSAFKTICSFHQFRRKWLCSIVFSSTITYNFEGIHDTVDTVDQNRVVIIAKEYRKFIE